MGNCIAILTAGPTKEIEAWLAEHNIKYSSHCGLHFCNWFIADDKDRLLFLLRWGIK